LQPFKSLRTLADCGVVNQLLIADKNRAEAMPFNRFPLPI
jgi:hypothetical protein